MGGSENRGTLHVDLASSSITAGDPISGTVHLVVTTATPASDLVLTLSGSESTEWSERIDDTDLYSESYSTTIKHFGQRNLLNQRFVMFRFGNEGCVPGQYSFPFEIQTTAAMPGSFTYQTFYIPLLDDSPTLAKISYRLEASLATLPGAIPPSICEIYVTRPCGNGSESAVSTSTTDVSTWLWASQGASTLSVRFDKTAYIPGETATVIIEVDHSLCSLSATAVTLSLSRRIEVSDSRGYTKSDSATLNSASLAVMVEPGNCVSSLTMDLMIPSELGIENATSVSGSLIHCEYTMTVEVKLDGWLTILRQKPMVTRTMVVYPQAVEKPSRLQVEAWQPRIMARQEFRTED